MKAISTIAEKHEQNVQQLRNIKRMIKKFKLSCTIQHVGSVSYFYFDKTGQVKKYGAFKPKPGMHIPKLVMRNVKERMQQGLYTPANTNPDRYDTNTIMYNPDNIAKYIGKHCVSIDINGCYWNTAYKIGLIDEKTYKMGLKKDKEYKYARNMSVGSLGASILIERYENGKKAYSQHLKRFGACARLDVIDYVWDISQQIGRMLQSDFLMFLTDCFYVPFSRMKDTCEMIESFGFSWKKTDVEFLKVDRMSEYIKKDDSHGYTDKVIWYDADEDKFKFHDFSDKHHYIFD